MADIAGTGRQVAYVLGEWGKQKKEDVKEAVGLGEEGGESPQATEQQTLQGEAAASTTTAASYTPQLQTTAGKMLENGVDHRPGAQSYGETPSGPEPTKSSLRPTARKFPTFGGKYIRVICIDGGGIRGLIPLMTLQVIEKKIQDRLRESGDPHWQIARLADYVDMMAGTSVGGIMACCFLLPNTLPPSGNNQFDMYERSRHEHAESGHAENGQTQQPVPSTKFSAVEIGHEVERLVSHMFTKPWPILGKYACLCRPNFSATAKREALRELLQVDDTDVRLSQLLRPCLLTAYDTVTNKPYLFCQHRAGRSKSAPEPTFTEPVPDEDGPIQLRSKSMLRKQEMPTEDWRDYWAYDACLASSAAPSLWEPALIFPAADVPPPRTSHRDEQAKAWWRRRKAQRKLPTETPDGALTLIDGGVICNNPSVVAFMELLALHQRLEQERRAKQQRKLRKQISSLSVDEVNALPKVVLEPDRLPPIAMLSLGCGSEDKPVKWHNARKWGRPEWLGPLVAIFVDGVAALDTYTIQHMLEALNLENRYFRVQKHSLAKRFTNASDITEENRAGLRELGMQVAAEHDQILEEFVDCLMAVD
eukprot:jgi/Chlat1/5635/Chrsp369S05410